MKEDYQILEEKFGELMGYPPENMVACASGTAALHLALESITLPRDSKVGLSDYVMIACARAIHLASREPVLLDYQANLLLDPDDCINALSSRSADDHFKCLMQVHIYGRYSKPIRTPRMQRMMVIEDMAEAHGIKPDLLTTAACWSFYRNKIIAGEEGGMVAFKDADDATLARSLRSLGFTPEHNFMHLPRGHNYRMSNCHAYLILRSLAQFPANLEFRRESEMHYEDYCPKEWRMPRRDSPWVYDFLLPTSTVDPNDIDHTPREICQSLQAQGIQARMGFKPISWQPEFCFYSPRRTQEPNVPNRYPARVMYLPLSPRVSKEQAKLAFGIIQSVVDRSYYV